MTFIIILGIGIVVVILIAISNSTNEKERLNQQINQNSQEIKKLKQEIFNQKEEISEHIKKGIKYRGLIAKLEQKELDQNQWLEKQRKLQNEWIDKQYYFRDDMLNDINSHLTDRTEAYKWLAPLVADIMLELKERTRNSDELIKTKRSPSSQARVTDLLNEKRNLLEENATLQYQLEYIKTLIPETEDIIDIDEHKEEDENIDNPNHFLSKEEYELLSDREKNERALKYYITRSKRNWEIGRDFERYIGYLYEKQNYDVEYFGMEMKLNDLGRDLIVTKNNKILIVQCKYWSKNKMIHEKHIAQLYGTIAKYKFDNPSQTSVKGIFVTHTVISDVAKSFAQSLGIDVRENVDLGEYPMIKCKNGRDEYGTTQIYHLPMDQQYDRTKIIKQNGDCYAFTIDEAESKGFRRAYKWHGEGV
jgi:hypothetical protein